LQGKRYAAQMSQLTHSKNGPLPAIRRDMRRKVA
jgi:hypothetical protein